MKPIILIPARLSATRLPNKPLADIAGEPMIVHVWRKATASLIARVVVACDHPDIQSAITARGGEAILTDPHLPSGSDRIWQALCSIDPPCHFDTIINLQGDLPTLDSDLIGRALEPLKAGFDVSTLAALIKNPEEIDRDSVVKIALSGHEDDRIRQAFYFSRRAIPYGEGPYYHHIGIYGYKRQALEKFVACTPTVLEKREKLEQLRALELGLTLGVSVVDTIPIGVDTPQDLERVRIMLQKTF